MASEGISQNGKNSGYRSFDGADGEVRIQDGEAWSHKHQRRAAGA